MIDPSRPVSLYLRRIKREFDRGFARESIV